MSRKYMVLFLGSGMYSFPLMAEGLFQQMVGSTVSTFSAFLRPAEPHPIACSVMADIDISIAESKLLTPLDIEVFSFDMVVTLGDFDPSYRLNLPGMPPHFHWDLPIPDAGLSAEEQTKIFRKVRELLRRRIEEVLSTEMLEGLHIVKRNLELVLDNLSDGVMAHTMNRRIFYFNKAAEKLTGFKRRDILGKDCHKVFRPKRFCGGDCSFCSSTVPQGEEIQPKKKQVSFTRKDKVKRVFDMTVMPLSDAQATNVGALVSFKDNTELYTLKKRISHHHTCGDLIGKDPKTLELFEQIREVGPVNIPVLIEGESGTGKELVARAVHQLSQRSDMPFVAINCGALPEGILESELFGHVRGSFTGAVKDQKGRFELADGGTIFLDEVGELSLATQVKLLRVLQEHRFERVGGEKEIQVDVRVVSATNQNLVQLMEKKRFRRDLYYRLCVVPIHVPALRERRIDIPVLVDYFLDEVSRETGKPLISLSSEVLDALTQYHWLGNIRELRNVIEYSYVKCRTGIMTLNHLPKEIQGQQDKRGSRPGPDLKLSLEQVTAALAEAENNKSKAASILGVGRSTLYRFMRTHRLK